MSSTEAITTSSVSDEYKVYKQRWIMLLIFTFLSGSNGIQWIQYSIIADVIVKYYNVSYTAVDWTSIIYMLLYVPFVFVGNYVVERVGLRKAVLIGTAGTSIGMWLKVGSVSPDRFWLGFIGQSVSSVTQVVILNIPPKIAAVWFGPTQVSTACSIAILGNQLGVAVGFLIPPIIVTGGDTDAVTKQIYILFIAVAVETVLLFIVVLIFFKDAPPLPPSMAQVQAKTQNLGNSENIWATNKRLFSNPNYIVMLISFGIVIGVYNAFSTLINQLILKHYPEGAADAGRIGLIYILVGMIGSIIFGLLLDRFRRFKETFIAIYFGALILMVAITFTLPLSIVIVYIITGLFGFFLAGILPVGFEFAAEITFPEPEETAGGLLMASTQMFGIVFTIIYAEMFRRVGDLWANVTMSILTVIGIVLSFFIKSDLRRQAAGKAPTEEKVA